MRKMFIFVPAFGHNISAATFMTTHALQQALASKSIQAAISSLSFPDIAELRSMAATIWYDTMPDVESMLFIDADMGFPPDLVLDMILFGEPLVGTIYPQRRMPVSWAGSGSGSSTTERRGNFMAVEGVGMGCTLIRREVMAKMVQKFPELVDERIDLHPAAEMIRSTGARRIIRAFEKLDIPERGVVSEDLSFCIRHNQCGGQVWAAINYRISHVGAYDYAACYAEHVAAQQAAVEAGAQLQIQQIAPAAPRIFPMPPVRQEAVLDTLKVSPPAVEFKAKQTPMKRPRNSRKVPMQQAAE